MFVNRKETICLRPVMEPSRHEMSLRDLNQISIERDISRLLRNILKEMVFGEVFKTSQIRLKKDVFFCKVFETSQKLLEKGVFCVTSLRRLEHISRKMSFWWHLWERLKNISDNYLRFYQNILQNWFRVNPLSLWTELKYRNLINRYQSSLS